MKLEKRLHGRWRDLQDKRCCEIKKSGDHKRSPLLREQGNQVRLPCPQIADCENATKTPSIC